jgi:hypothetical protein
MNSAELDKLRQEDPTAYQAAENIANGVVASEEVPVAAPPSGKRTIWRNGEQVELSESISYVNGMPVIQQ